MNVLFDFGTVMFAGYDADGHPVVQPDVLGSSPGVDPSETHHLFGFMGQPVDPILAPDGSPIPHKSGSLMYARSGDDIHVFPLGNPRFIAALPKLKNGSSMQYGGPPEMPSYGLIDGVSGAFTLYVPGATAKIAHGGGNSVEVGSVGTRLTGPVAMGQPDAAIPVALATPLLAYLALLEAAVVASATSPAAISAATALTGGGPSLKASIAATLVKGT